ncbi:hypothetical protein GCM10023168_11770 [Fodinibacter luteus]|uniref:LPXTG cell wall anchor domain-containing protein n=1 Tax=Fodinibacter luteus TaxID=552064 RepID=A0ABP8K7S4_9MICO
MHRRVIKSLIPLVGAAALVAAPIALAAPASAAPVDPDENKTWFWENYLLEEEGILALCVNEGSPETPFVVPEIEDFFTDEQIDEVFGDVDDADLAYVLGVVKAGGGEDASEVVVEPEVGDKLAHSNKKDNSHVILCIAELEPEEPEEPEEETPGKPKPKPPVKGPVVETDRVSDSGSAAGLGLAAAATALVAGAGVIVVSRRRQGDHR